MSVVPLIYSDPPAWMGGRGCPGAILVMLGNNLAIILPTLMHAFIAAAGQTLDPLLLSLVDGPGAVAGEAPDYFVVRSGGKTLGRRLSLCRNEYLGSGGT